jgi:hypothetical protein
MRKLEIQYDLKPNGAVIRINNYKGCILRICRIPKELVFDENGNVREFIDLAYSQPEVINQSKIPDQDKWIYPEPEIIIENLDNIETIVSESIDTNDFHKKLTKVLKENPELKSTDGNTKITFNQDVIDHMEKEVDIHAKKGTKVKLYMKDGKVGAGYDCQGERALKYLIPETIYHIKEIKVYNWNTDIYLEEFPELPFNFVMFERVNENDIIFYEHGCGM